MNKSELIRAVSESTHLTQDQVARVIDSVIYNIQKSLAQGKKVTLMGFGTFKTHERAARMGRNPSTGKSLPIPAKVVPKFSAGIELRKMLDA